MGFDPIGIEPEELEPPRKGAVVLGPLVPRRNCVTAPPPTEGTIVADINTFYTPGGRPLEEVLKPTRRVPVFMSTDSAVRKLMPITSGCLAYFPDALLLVAWVSRVGNEKHNPGEPLHWAKEKSTDEPDAEVRHMLDHLRGVAPDPGLEPLGELGHLASKVWRALAHLQRACDAKRAEHEGKL